MADALLFHTADGGDLEIVNGQVTTANGVYTAVYLSLFGGNEEDEGGSSTDHLQWWGNLDEDEPARRYRSRTPAALRLPAATSNLRAVKEAAEADLAWMVEAEIADEPPSVRARLTAPKRCEIDISIVINGERYPFTFDRPWGPTE